MKISCLKDITLLTVLTRRELLRFIREPSDRSCRLLRCLAEKRTTTSNQYTAANAVTVSYRYVDLFYFYRFAINVSEICV